MDGFFSDEDSMIVLKIDEQSKRNGEVCEQRSKNDVLEDQGRVCDGREDFMDHLQRVTEDRMRIAFVSI